jgi:hypothetical protein
MRLTRIIDSTSSHGFRASSGVNQGLYQKVGFHPTLQSMKVKTEGIKVRNCE